MKGSFFKKAVFGFDVRKVFFNSLHFRQSLGNHQQPLDLEMGLLAEKDVGILTKYSHMKVPYLQGLFDLLLLVLRFVVHLGS